jgi:hypothetical protein
MDTAQKPAILLPMKTKTPTSTRILLRRHALASNVQPHNLGIGISPCNSNENPTQTAKTSPATHVIIIIKNVERKELTSKLHAIIFATKR